MPITTSVASNYSTNENDIDECQVCFAAPAVAVNGCGHRICCAFCLARHLETKLGDSDVANWVCCPAEGCCTPLGTQQLLSCVKEYGGPLPSVTVETLLTLPLIFLHKQLVRLPEWVACCSKDSTRKSALVVTCQGGILVTNENEGHDVPCPICLKTRIKAVRATEQPDDQVQKMIAEGIVRHCPTCSLPTMKEYGICNVINCERCSVWWNWKTKETGRSSRELKQKARERGTLWEPGELQFQQTLQQSDPEQFQSLLERNGMKYDPNYQRGSL